MTAANSARCIANTLVYEGGYGRNAKDRGDWTSGKIGVGELKGTAFGIAAMTLKDRGLEGIDLKSLTRDRAIEIYRRDEWKSCGGDALPEGIDQVTFDATVNSGVGRGVPWTAKALGVSGNLSAVVAAARSATDKVAVVKKACAIRTSFLKGLSTFVTFGKGWMTRVAGIEAIGVKMVLQARGKPSTDIVKELNKESRSASKTSKANGTAAGGAVTGGAGGASQADPSSFDWMAWVGAGVLGLMACALIAFLIWQFFKHRERSAAYAAAADGSLGG